MKIGRHHTFARRHYRSFAFYVHVDRESFAVDLTLGRHTWSLEVEW